MVTPLSPDELVRILRAEGVRVAEYPGWRTRSRDAATGNAFGPVHLIVNHHTAGSNSLDVIARNGVPGLPAPLAHTHLDKTGLATMCSAGRANHAGLVASNAYTSFLEEEATHPAPSKASGTLDGNDVAYGIEVENLGNGADVYTRAQYDAWVRWNAAICRRYGWSAESVAGHLETSVEGKIDPRGPVEGYGRRGRFAFSMAQFRKDVAERLTHPAAWNPEEDDMPNADEIATAVLKKDGIISIPGAPASNPTWTLSSSITEILKRLDKANAALAAQSAAITALAGQLGRDVDTAAVVAAVEAAIASAVVRVDVTVADRT